jgi:hypothetical protein
MEVVKKSIEKKSKGFVEKGKAKKDRPETVDAGSSKRKRLSEGNLPAPIPKKVKPSDSV